MMLRVMKEKSLKKSIMYLTRIKVRSGQKIFEVDVALWLSLFQHDHGICLSQQRPGSTQFSELDQLQHNLHQETNVCLSKGLGENTTQSLPHGPEESVGTPRLLTCS